MAHAPLHFITMGDTHSCFLGVSVCLSVCLSVFVLVCMCVLTLILTVTVSPKGACVGERVAELSAMRTQDVVATAAQRVH